MTNRKFPSEQGGDSANSSEVELPPGYSLPGTQPQPTGEMLRAKLLGETARAPWTELQRFFAQGVMLMAQPGVDMIAVAMALADDDSAAFEKWLHAGEAGVVSDEQALAWHAADATLWTVVVKPWVLVQECAEDPSED